MQQLAQVDFAVQYFVRLEYKGFTGNSLVVQPPNLIYVTAAFS